MRRGALGYTPSMLAAFSVAIVVVLLARGREGADECRIVSPRPGPTSYEAMSHRPVENPLVERVGGENTT